jgi:hypothetical protein
LFLNSLTPLRVSLFFVTDFHVVKELLMRFLLPCLF